MKTDILSVFTLRCVLAFVTCNVRNYLEHVAGTIVEWIQQEEAKYQAALLAAEVEEIHGGKPKPVDGAQKKKGRDGSKSPKPNSR